jgi:hypothetical protein
VIRSTLNYAQSAINFKRSVNIWIYEGVSRFRLDYKDLVNSAKVYVNDFISYVRWVGSLLLQHKCT